jgi:preprotein translocase subunit SecA
MLGGLARKFFGNANDRIVRGYMQRVDAINRLEPQFEKLSDAELAAKTEEFRTRLKNGIPLDKLLPEAFATVREASKRVLGMRHFDVQMIGGMVLHEGNIAEMKTGEGKTLVATLPVYLNALEGKGVHVVTVNDYLATRDAAWMGKLYNFLGLTVGTIVHGKDDFERQEAYNCDITYGTNNEYGFDYLRDNMKYSRLQMVQRPFNFAIVDEVDSILIDEARTPLIISGPTEDNSALYVEVDKILPLLTAADYEKDEKTRAVALNEEGTHKVEELLRERGLLEADASLYDIGSISLVHHVNQALKAHTIFQRDVDYIVKDNKVIIIDEFTGRMMEGRRYSDGLHQALEAKEKVAIQNENQTLASITFQNYFRLYPKLAGMTGTAMTEATEFSDIYSLEVIEIPTNVAVSREDFDDEIYRTSAERNEAVIALIKECHERQQPVLVGTVSIEKSEHLSSLLKKAKVPHQVLNARHHEKEAYIVGQAGRPGAVTIATNMAGRGTDIKLGGNAEMRIEEETANAKGEAQRIVLAEQIKEEVERDKQTVLEAGGLYVIGTERHESRRIDNQLRGRSGRQGDPGASKFFISLEDDLMRIFGSERIDGMLQKLGMKEGEAIIHPWMNRAIERAQGKVEARNYDIRKNLLKFDDVMNDQRKVIYEQRIELMEADDLTDTINDMRQDVNDLLVEAHIPPKSYPEQWDGEGLEKELFRVYGLHLPASQWVKEEGIADEEIRTRLNAATAELFAAKDAEYTPDIMKMAKKRILLQTLDQLWKDHLLSLDHLRGGINLRAYAQRDPLNEYKSEAFGLFERMLTQLREVTISRLAHLQIRVNLPPEPLEEMAPPQHMREGRDDPAAQPHGLPEGAPVVRRTVSGPVNPADPTTWGRVGRNDACPCGSGKKFKHCHGQLS